MSECQCKSLAAILGKIVVWLYSSGNSPFSMNEARELIKEIEEVKCM